MDNLMNVAIILLVGIVILAILVISTPYILLKGAVDNMVDTLKQVKKIYVEGVEELLS